MSIARKRSHSDKGSVRLPLQSDGNHTHAGNEQYNMQVLSLNLGQTEEELDDNFLQTALNLGINIPQDPKTTLELVGSNVSALAISSNAPESYSIPSRTSESTHPPSSGSSVQQQPTTKASSVTTPSLPSITSAPASEASGSFKKGSYQKIRRGIRRLSIIGRRQTTNSSMPGIHFRNPSTELVDTTNKKRPSTADPTRPSFVRQSSLVSIPRKNVPPIAPAISLGPLPSNVVDVRPKTIAFSHGELFETEENLEARQRSIMSTTLKRLRAQQLEEQSRFIRFENEQNRQLRTKRTEARKDIVGRQQEEQQALRERHAEALVDTEHRHFAAEIELVRTLDLDRKACNTKLKHMEAYCNGRHSMDGIPRRKVTEDDYRKLVQQYHLRSGMDNLHEARINVLREKQAKQLERIAAKQVAASKAAVEADDKELQEHERESNAEAYDMTQEFARRRKRLIARWKLAEAIERRKLEVDSGELYGPLPGISWPDEVKRKVSRPFSMQVGIYDAVTLSSL
ncbi:hypothetical protein MMC06_004458 [Schaereria dolodes]|nr:hypothetical protein [Schaereria dolodes]